MQAKTLTKRNAEFKTDIVIVDIDDKSLEKEGVRLFVDSKSSVFINGMVLDHSGGLNGTGFTFKNPNAAKSCGCGTSFAV